MSTYYLRNELRESECPLFNERTLYGLEEFQPDARKPLTRHQLD